MTGVEDTAELVAAVEGICAGSGEPAGGGIDHALWQDLERHGFTLVGVPERLGGSGGAPAQAAAVLRGVARACAAVPLAETAWLAGWLLAESGIAVPAGPLTAALADPSRVELVPDAGGWRIDGMLRRVPWAGSADLLVLLAGTRSGHVVVRLRPDEVAVRPGRNVAGESRDDVWCRGIHLDARRVAPAGAAVTPAGFRDRAALSRVVALAGAAEEVLAVAVRHAGEREQFGRPIAALQAVQQLLARLAGEVASIGVAADAATRALAEGPADRAAFAVAAARSSAARSAGDVAAWGHQVLGALGFTAEHPLHRSTTRLWAWRDDFGGERSHERELGRRLLATDPWELITGG